MKIQLTIFLAISSTAVIAVPVANKFAKNDHYSPAEQIAIKEFRELVGPLPQPDMSTDEFLINWIRRYKDTSGGHQVTRNGTYYAVTFGQGFDLNKATKNLEKTLAWRKDNKIDKIIFEDFSDLQKEYPLDVSLKDKESGPASTTKSVEPSLRCSGVCVTERFTIYCEVLDKSNNTCSKDLKCCVTPEYYTNNYVTNPNLVLVKAKESTSTIQIGAEVGSS